ncbi:MAG: hypothetical protein ACLQVI_01855 [Polyangiaceae bacterium]|jgi:hypothetical protein
MSQFISLRILAAMGLGRSKKTSNRETPGAPPVVEGTEIGAGEREEPSSASRLSVNRIRVEG